ncbi:MAG: HAMP domain-containing protein [Candidatus Adiutrix sp.]|jgi:signal transduction histidine kinase|nr:HAMP domain-containing protein [Candidatus Adiutrix sp.]
MPRGLRAQLSLLIALIVLLTVLLVSALSNVLIGRQYERHVLKQEVLKAEAIADNISRQYDALSQKWDESFIHGLGMYSLYDGYIIKVADADGRLVWDAENHDMAACSQVMMDIIERMDARRPSLSGEFAAHTYELTSNGRLIGSVEVSYYGPYFLSESDLRFLDTLNAILAAVGALALAAAVLAGWVLARRVARPIVKAAKIARRIADGDYAIRFDGRTKTREADELADALNHLADALDRQERLRRRLVTDIAHELRTPVSAISSHLEIMLEGVWEPTTERLQSVYDEIGRLGVLVSDLGRLAQAEGENFRLQKSDADLLALARSVADGLETEAQKKNIALVVKGATSVLSADKDRIGQVVANLISNAIKYTPEGGQVRVSVRDSAEAGVISVEDNGIGLQEAELPLVFERFYRTDVSRNRKTGGVGIGLTIAKSIVTAHGGTVTAESEFGKGSNFTVRLPK